MDGHEAPQLPEPDRRARPREGCMIRARIGAPGLAAFDCTIWDMSTDGARIVIGDASVPDDLQISIPILGLTKQATIRWRKAGQIGVSFGC